MYNLFQPQGSKDGFEFRYLIPLHLSSWIESDSYMSLVSCRLLKCLCTVANGFVVLNFARINHLSILLVAIALFYFLTFLCLNKIVRFHTTCS